jgi:hypothetical protein
VPALVARQLVKDRLLLAAIPEPIDPDLDRIIATASQMVIDRCVPFDLTAPPDAVQQVVLMLAVRMRTQEIGNYTDNEGRPIQRGVWTQDLTDILGPLIADVTPQQGVGLVPTAGVMSRTAILPTPVPWADANDPYYSGMPYPRRIGGWWG